MNAWNRSDADRRWHFCTFHPPSSPPNRAWDIKSMVICPMKTKLKTKNRSGYLPWTLWRNEQSSRKINGNSLCKNLFTSGQKLILSTSVMYNRSTGICVQKWQKWILTQIKNIYEGVQNVTQSHYSSSFYKRNWCSDLGWLPGWCNWRIVQLHYPGFERNHAERCVYDSGRREVLLRMQGERRLCDSEGLFRVRLKQARWYTPTLLHLIFAGGNLELLVMDIPGPLLNTLNGSHFTLVMTYIYSKLRRSIPTP